MNVLVVPDKFKGTLTAAQAAAAITRGWQRVRPQDEIDALPMSDGGDGFGEVLSHLLGAQPQRAPTVDAAHRPLEATWWWHAATGMAVIESARVIGLAMLPPGQFHPTELDTYGLGAVLDRAAAQGATYAMVGIGGSATNDGGFGLARAFGWRFLNAEGAAITRWTDLGDLAEVTRPSKPMPLDDLVVAVDVLNPLLGPRGCSRVYGPQKGLVDFDAAERALGRLAQVMATQTGVDYASQPGAGAAGGLGFGLQCFAGARLRPGIEMFMRHAHLEERLHASQLVITGEGALDAQTMMGKGVGAIAALCRTFSVPCMAIAGVIPDRALAASSFDAVYALTPDLTDRESALDQPALWLERTAAHAARDWR